MRLDLRHLGRTSFVLELAAVGLGLWRFPSWVLRRQCLMLLSRRWMTLTLLLKLQKMVHLHREIPFYVCVSSS